MSNQPFGQAPAFGSPAPPPLDAPPVVEPTTGTKRTVLIAAAVGVVALAVLGGAAVLVGPGDDGVDDAVAVAPVPAVPVEPSVAPTAASTPLPTAVTRSRNVFVPLVEEGGAEGESSAAAEAPPAATGATTGTSGGTGSDVATGTGSGTGTGTATGTGGTGTGTGSGTGTGTGSAVPVIVYDPVVQDMLDAAVTEIARLEAAIMDLEAELREESEDDSELEDEIERLQADLEKTQATRDALKKQIDDRALEDATRLFITFDEADEQTLEVTVDGETYVLELDQPEPVATNGETPLNLTYRGLQDDPDSEVDQVLFTYVSGTSAVQLGATVSFPR